MGEIPKHTGPALLPAVLASTSIVIGALVLLGWATGRSWLTTFVPEHSATQPLSALLLVLAGSGLLAWAMFRRLGVAAALAAACLLLSLLIMLQHGGHGLLDLDEFLFPHVVRQQSAYLNPGRPSLPTVCAFAALSLAIIAVPVRHRMAGLFCSAASTIGIVITLISLLGHLFGLTGVTGALGFTQMALPTTLGVGALSIAILAIRQEAGWVSLLVGPSVGATVGRWLLPTIMVVPILVASLAFTGGQAGLYSTTFRMILITTTTVVLLGAFTLWGAAQLDQLEGVRKAADDLRRSEAALRLAEEQQRVLANELHHRVKNTITVVQAIAHQTFKQPVDLTEAKGVFDDRLRSLAGAHDLLVRQDAGGSSLSDVVRRSIEGGCGYDPDRVFLNGPDIVLASRQTLAMSMIVHELCTNAVKYGALSNDRGTVTVSWQVQPLAEGSQLTWLWQEADGPAVTPRERSGFGSKLIERILAADLNGAATMEFAVDGLRCQILASLNGETDGDGEP